MRQRSCVENGFGSNYVVRSVYNVMRLAQHLEEHLRLHGPWLISDQYTLAEIDYSPFLARLEALDMLGVFFDGKEAAGRWWEACKIRDCFRLAAVGPAAGDEAERYAHSGRNARD